jgi:hypothetical protein
MPAGTWFVAPTEECGSLRPSPVGPTGSTWEAIGMSTPLKDSAVWTGDCSATVHLDRCDGPRGGRVRAPTCWVAEHPGRSFEAVDLGDRVTKIALYECCLTKGTSFAIYRWVNLEDLVELWPELRLPPAVRAEWEGALTAAGLLQRHRLAG